MNNAVKKTLQTLALILVFSFILDKAVYFSLNFLSDKVFSGHSIGKLNQYLEQKDALELIVFGTSRANHHIDVGMFNKQSFNVGTDGTSIGYSATLIQQLPKEKHQIVLWHLDPNKVFDTTYSGNDLGELKVKYHRNDMIKSEIKNSDQHNPLQDFYWSLDYNGKALSVIKNFIKPSYNYLDYDGYDPMIISESQKKLVKKTLEIKEDKNCDTDFLINERIDNYLKNVKEFCNKNNKQLIVFTSPQYIDYCPEDNKALKKVLKKIGITYYDYTNFFNGNNSIELWKDRTHLSAKGATILTKEIKQTLIQSN